MADTTSVSSQLWDSTFGAHERRFRRDIHSSTFSSQSKLYKGRKGGRRRQSFIPMNLWQNFFSSYPPVDSLSDSYKSHPSLRTICLSLNWLETSSSLIDLEKLTFQTRQNLQIVGATDSTLGSTLFLEYQHEGEINGKSIAKRSSANPSVLSLSPSVFPSL